MEVIDVEKWGQKKMSSNWQVNSLIAYYIMFLLMLKC